MLRSKDVEQIKNIYVQLFFENRAIYGIMWPNVVEPDRLPMTT